MSSFAAALALKHQKRSRLNRSLRTSQTLTPASAAAALAALVASLLTPDWLRTVERMPNDNRTVLWGPDKSPEYLRKLSHSGLFRLCYTEREWKNNNKQIFLKNDSGEFRGVICSNCRWMPVLKDPRREEGLPLSLIRCQSVVETMKRDASASNLANDADCTP